MVIPNAVWRWAVSVSRSRWERRNREPRVPREIPGRGLSRRVGPEGSKTMVRSRAATSWSRGPWRNPGATPLAALWTRRVITRDKVTRKLAWGIGVKGIMAGVRVDLSSWWVLLAEEPFAPGPILAESLNTQNRAEAPCKIAVDNISAWADANHVMNTQHQPQPASAPGQSQQGQALTFPAGQAGPPGADPMQASPSTSPTRFRLAVFGLCMCAVAGLMQLYELLTGATHGPKAWVEAICPFLFCGLIGAPYLNHRLQGIVALAQVVVGVLCGVIAMLASLQNPPGWGLREVALAMLVSAIVGSGVVSLWSLRKKA